MNLPQIVSKICSKTLPICAALLLASCTANPLSWWAQVNQKAKHLMELDAKYAALEAAHEKLRREFFELEQQHNALASSVRSKVTAEHNLKATGSIVGRTKASIDYKVPPGLQAKQILNLAFEHMREERFGEAAVTFDQFYSTPEGAASLDARTFYSAGVAWFQMDNFKKAKEFFDSAKTHAAGEKKEWITKKVELWTRVIDRKIASEGEGTKSGGH